MATERQKKANRKNAKKGGPKSKKGKEVVRTNARKHGIFAAALTKFDEDELAGIYDELVAWCRPVGPVEKLLVEKLAHTYLRLQRCARAEAEVHISTWEPTWDIEWRADRYLHRERYRSHTSWFDRKDFDSAVRLFARYDQTLTNQLIKLLHEIERFQRMRLGDNVPPPVVADVTVHGVDDAQPPDGSLTVMADVPAHAPGNDAPLAVVAPQDGSQQNGSLELVPDVPAADYTGTGIRPCDGRSREVPVSG